MAMMGRHTGCMQLPARSRPTLLRVRAQSQNGLPSRTAVGATATYLQVESLNGGPALQTEQRPITVNVTSPEVQPQLYTPAENYANLAKLGAKKSEMSPAKLFVSGILAGCYIAFGGFLMCAVAGNMQSLPVGVVKLISGLIFPVGLLMVTMSGSELYTGNTAVIPMAMYEGKASLGGLLTNWFWSYAGNYVGSLAMVAAVAATGVLAGNVVPVNVATMKASLPLATVLVRSTLCNWLVCMAVWHAASATTLPGKMMGLWAPIATFVAIGLEHSVANMFFIPMGMVLGAKVTFSEFMLNNLLPVTLGNTLGGFLFVGTAFSFLYGRLGQPKAAAAAAAS